jgi:hypothetical protein
MAIQANASTEVVVGAGFKLYTGISEFKVIAVNPTMDELHALGIMVQSEPKYQVLIKEKEVQKIVFWLKNADTSVSCEFLVNPGPWKSSTGKVKVLNIIGQDQWLVQNADGTFDTSNLPTFIKEADTFYVIPRGLDRVTDFIKAWANVADGDEVKLDTIPQLEKGNVNELKQLVKALQNNTVRVLVYVREGKYPAIYTEHFGRVNPKRDDLFLKAMASSDYGQVKGEYTIEWQEYVPGALTADPITDTTSGDDWTMPESPLSGDDDPFK